MIVPLSAVRWVLFVKDIKNPTALFATMSLASLLGFFDVILLLTTRRSSGLFGRLMFLRPARPPSIHDQDAEMEGMDRDLGLGMLP